MELACPRCGAINREDAVDFPFCHQCHEPLVKCGYCRYFDPGQVVCAHPRVVQRQVQAETLPNCEYFAPKTLRRFPSLKRRPVPAPWWIAGLTLLLAVLLVLVLQIIPRTSTGIFDGRLELEPDWPQSLSLDRTNPIAITITNPASSKDPTGPLLMRMPRAFFEEFQVAQIEPQPLRQQLAGKSVLLRYPSLKPGGTLKVTFFARPRKEARGSYRCVVQAGMKNFKVDLGRLNPAEISR